jgi:hypothetical protein
MKWGEGGRSVTNCPAPDDRWAWNIWWNENWQGKPDSEETCPSATLFTTNPTWLELGWTPDHRDGKPASNRLSYITAMVRMIAMVDLARNMVKWLTFVVKLHGFTKWQEFLNPLKVSQAYEPWRLTMIAPSCATTTTVRSKCPSF